MSTQCHVPIVCTLPTDIVEHILADVALAGSINRKVFTPQFDVARLLLFCKPWHPVVERRLYQAVSLGHWHASDGLGYWDEYRDPDDEEEEDGDDSYDDTDEDEDSDGETRLESRNIKLKPFRRTGHECTKLFTHTITNNRRLAALVRSVRLGTQDHPESECENHIKILERCRNIRDVEIRGFWSKSRKAMHDALRQLPMRSIMLRYCNPNSVPFSDFSIT